MSALEQIEKNKVKLTFEVTPERFREGLQYSYNKNKGYVTIPGFRKGKAPRKVIERTYGKDFFYDDAINHVLPDAYEQALDEQAVDPVYKPSIKMNRADEETGLEFEAEVYIKPEVTIDGYYGLTYPKWDTTATESDIQAKLQAECEKNARQISVEGPAVNGDIVTINFEGFTNGVPFEGGKGSDHDLTLGSRSFISGFEEQLEGHRVGDDVEVKVTFPEDYHHEALAGQDAVFQVEILDIKKKEYPEIDDEFAQDVSEFETLAEYRQHLSEKIREEKEKQAETEKRSQVMEQLVNKAEMDVPAVMYTARVDEMVQDMRHWLERQGMTMEMYLSYAQMTEEALRDSYKRNAKADVDSLLVLEAVAKNEQFVISDEEYREHLEKMMPQGTNIDELIEKIVPERKKEIELDIARQKALTLVLDNAVAVEEAFEEV